MRPGATGARPRTARLWTAANILMAMVFAFGVVVQFNDPDPLRWSLAYGVAAFACGLEACRRGAWQLPALVAAAALVWALTIGPDVIGRVPLGNLFDAFEMRDVQVERAREVYGLLILAGWMLVLAAAGLRRRPASAARGVVDARDRKSPA